MKRLTALLCWLVAAPAALAGGAEFEARLWAPDLAGTAQLGAGEAAVDLVGDLGFADDEALEGRLVWQPSRRVSLRIDWSSFDFGGDARLDRTLSLGGTTFAVDAEVSSRLELESGGFGLAWQLLSTADGRFRLGPLLEARGLRGEATVRADVLGILPLSAREEFELAFGAAGLLLDAEASRRLHLQARWIASVGADEGDLTDVEAAVRFLPLDELALFFGYRRIEIQSLVGDDRIHLELDGPFFGGVLRY